MQTKRAMQRKPFIACKYFTLCLYVAEITYLWIKKSKMEHKIDIQSIADVLVFDKKL